MRETLITDHKNSLPFIDNQNNLELKDAEISIKNHLYSSDLRISIELCPNRNLDTEVLSEVPCSFCSVTWFPPTAEQLQNVETIPAIRLAKKLRCHGYNVLLHLAGRNLNKYQILHILAEVKNNGIRNILALQGDATRIVERDKKRCDFPYAADLVKFIRSSYGYFFTIGVAGYPEKHPNSENMESDLENLKNKVSCGADFILTQASYDYLTFSSFVKQCRSIGIHIPVIPGIFIISSYGTLTAMSKFCGVPIPQNILEIVGNIKENNEAVREFGITLASEMMKIFLKNRELFGGIHVFPLNNLELLRNVMFRVGFCFIIERPFKLKYDLN